MDSLTFFPVKLDLEPFLKRLHEEQQALSSLLARFEGELRHFETKDLPAYEEWIRLELGPALSSLDEITQQIHERRILAYRVNSLVQNEGLHPREALYVALAKEDFVPEAAPEVQSKNKGWDADEIEARRRAKIESKRARRKEERREKIREKRVEQVTSAAQPSRLVSLYRSLARLLHPDSPLLTEKITATQALDLWHEVQTAYDSGNLDRIVSIAAWLDHDSNSVASGAESLSYGERVERVRAMRKSVRRLEQTLQDLSLHAAWGFLRKQASEKKKLRKKAARELEEEIARTQSILEQLEDFIDSIGPARKPKSR